MSRRSITHVGGVLLALLLSLLVVTPSAAIQITAGQASLFTISGGQGGNAFLSADLTGFGGFSLNATALAGTDIDGRLCQPWTFFREGRDARCNPGDRVAVAAAWDTQFTEGGLFFPPPPFQTATLHGAAYRVSLCGLTCSGELAVIGTFATADFLAPSFLVGDVFTLEEPFVFAGSIRYRRTDGRLVTEPLTGSGIVTVELTKTDRGLSGTTVNHDTLWEKTQHTYDFLAPSPEPPPSSSGARAPRGWAWPVGLGAADTSPSMPRKPAPPPNRGRRKALPDELARDAIAHEKAAPGDRVEMVFRVRLRKPAAEALTAWAVREETNLVALVAEIPEAAVTKGRV